MADGNSRRNFFKILLSMSAFSGASVLSFKRNIGSRIAGLSFSGKASAMDNPDYASRNSANELKIEYMGMSCFLITTSNGARIITDPFYADNDILHPELRKEPADVVTVSCGNYAHCYVYAVGGMPYIFKRTAPATINGITFRGVATRHLEMTDIGRTRPDENIVVCLEADGINICHLGALGHRLSDEQIKQIGKVDILMVPVGGVSTLPLTEAVEVCDQLKPNVIIPMHFRSERCTYSSWATVDEFLKLKGSEKTARGARVMLFKEGGLPSETKIMVPGYPH